MLEKLASKEKASLNVSRSSSAQQAQQNAFALKQMGFFKNVVTFKMSWHENKEACINTIKKKQQCKPKHEVCV